nr:hypothetical protein [Candidatus Eisenbacteria bacterium]
RTVRARVLARSAFAPGVAVAGPAVVHDDGATLWLPPSWSAVARADGTLALTLSGVRGRKP